MDKEKIANEVLTKKVEDLYKTGKIQKATDERAIRKIPSYVFPFDFLTKGGIPEGKFTLFYGDKSTGKSTFSLRLIRSFLMDNPERLACYIDFENSYDRQWAFRIVGEELLDRVIIAHPRFAEEGIEVFQKLTEGYPDYEIGLWVVDSIATMVPMSEAESDADQIFVGQIARAANSFFRKMLPHTVSAYRTGKPVTVILINQIRQGFNAMRIPVEVKPGGKFQEALVSLEIKFSVNSINKDKETGVPYNAEYKFTVEKNKVNGVPKVAGRYVMSMIDTESTVAGEVIDGQVMVQFMKKLEILTQEGSKWRVMEDEYKTQKELIDRLKTQHDYKKKLTEIIIEKGYRELKNLITNK